jgi:hypothetical protein
LTYLAVLTPRRAGPLISSKTLSVYTLISVYTCLSFCALLGFCALHCSCAPLSFCTPLGFCTLLGFCTPLGLCAPLSFCALLRFLHSIRLERLGVRALDFSVYSPNYIHFTPQPQVSRLIFTPHYCNTLYKTTNAKPPIPNNPFYFSKWRNNNLFKTGYANS